MSATALRPCPLPRERAASSPRRVRSEIRSCSQPPTPAIARAASRPASVDVSSCRSIAISRRALAVEPAQQRRQVGDVGREVAQARDDERLRPSRRRAARAPRRATGAGRGRRTRRRAPPTATSGPRGRSTRRWSRSARAGRRWPRSGRRGSRSPGRTWSRRGGRFLDGRGRRRAGPRTREPDPQRGEAEAEREVEHGDPGGRAERDGDQPVGGKHDRERGGLYPHCPAHTGSTTLIHEPSSMSARQRHA